MYFRMPCGHVVCSFCINVCHCERGCAPYFECPAVHGCHRNKIDVYYGHRSRSVAEDTTTRSGAGGGSANIIDDPVETFRLSPPTLKESQYYCHEKLPFSLKTDDVYLSITYGKSSTQTDTIVAKLKRQGFGKEHAEALAGEEDKDKLEAIFRLTHSLVDWSNPDAGSSNIEVLPTPDEDGSCPVYAVDRSLAHRLVHALGTGDRLEDDMRKVDTNEDKRAWKKRVNTSFMATDGLRKLNTKSGEETAIQKLFDEQLLIHGATQAILDLVHLFGIGSSRHKNRAKGRSMAESVIARGWDPKGKKWDVILVVFDNLGFKTLGGKKLTFDQYTTVQIITIPKEDLVKWKIYPNPDSDIPADHQTLVSREPNFEWTEDSRETVDVRRYLLPHTAENKRFGRSSLSSWARTMRDCNNAPFAEDCRQFIAGGTPIDRSRASIPKRYGAGEVEAEDGTVTAQLVTQLSEDQVGNGDAAALDPAADDVTGLEETDPNQTKSQRRRENIMKANNAESAQPLHADLCSTVVVEHLLDQSIKVTELALNDDTLPENDAEFWQNVVPASLDPDIAANAAGDGSPMYTGHIAIHSDPEKYHCNINLHSGPFHHMLGARKLKGRMFDATHMRPVVSAWRHTGPQQDWLIAGPDPTEYKKEYYSAQYAIRVNAIRKAAKYYATLAGAEDATSYKITPVQVVDYMIKCAEKSPLRMAFLIELRYSEVIDMMDDAIRQCDGDEYAAAMKISASLFFAGHSTKYAVIISEFVVWWYCASDAARLLYAKGMMTRKTQHGDYKPTDEYFEWFQKDIRSFLGKFMRVNTETDLAEVCATMEERIDIRDRFSVGTKERVKTNRLIVSESFCQSYIYCENLCLWEWDEQVQAHWPGKYDKGTTPIPDYEFTSACGDHTECNTDVLFAASTGLQRFMAYLLEFKIRGELFQPERPETSVSLDFIHPLTSQKDERHKKEIRRCASTTTKTLDADYTSDELKDQLILANPLLTDAEKVAAPSDARKSDYVSAVKRARQLVIKADDTWAKTQKEAAEKKYSEWKKKKCETLARDMKAELATDFIKHTESVRDEYSTDEHTYDIIFDQDELHGTALDVDVGEGGQIEQGSQESMVSLGSFA
mmetsp:Transcript_28213/g.62819  ORF Transcript_28213/g.62819 Transcript_28213/m.62819 type:complete len:1114 (+) Transcript_28213:276-3617(+)